MQIHLKIRLKEDVYFLWVNFGFFKTEVRVCEKCNFRIVESDYEVLKATTCWEWLKWVTIGRVKRRISRLKVKTTIRNRLKMFIGRLFTRLAVFACKGWRKYASDSPFEESSVIVHLDKPEKRA